MSAILYPRGFKPPLWPLSPRATDAPEVWLTGSSFYPMLEGGGTTARDYGTTRRDGTLAGVTWTPTIRGIGIKGNGTSGQFAATGHQLTQWTHEVLFIPTTATTQPILTIAEAPGDSTTDRLIGINGSGQFLGYVFDGATKTATSTRTAVAGEPVHIVVTHNATTLALYLDGVLAASVAAGAAYTGYASPELVALYGSTTGADFAGARGDGTILFIGVHPRALSAQEVASRARDPFAWMRPRRTRTLYVAGGGAVSLTVADAFHAHAADSVSLTQANTLVVADSTHGHTAEAPTIAAAYSLTPAESTHGHTVDSPALVQANVLAAADASHAHAADSPSLTQANVLAPADALHGHAADEVTLTVAGSLGAQDSSHAHAAESPSLVQANTLAAQDAAHSHLADSVTLSEAIFLTVADALHAHGVDSPALVQAGVLVVADSLHAHGVDSLILTQAHLLAVQDALHGHLADTVFMGDLVGYLTGTLTVRPTLTGRLTVRPALTGTLTVRPS